MSLILTSALPHKSCRVSCFAFGSIMVEGGGKKGVDNRFKHRMYASNWCIATATISIIKSQ